MSARIIQNNPCKSISQAKINSFTGRILSLLYKNYQSTHQDFNEFFIFGMIWLVVRVLLLLSEFKKALYSSRFSVDEFLLNKSLILSWNSPIFLINLTICSFRFFKPLNTASFKCLYTFFSFISVYAFGAICWW